MSPLKKKAWLEKAFSKIKDLPTLPHLLVELIKLINDPRSSARELGRLISVDQSPIQLGCSKW
jgi:HD-like signal output (HDOD) protein